MNKEQTITEKLGLHGKITQKHSEEIEEIIQEEIKQILEAQIKEWEGEKNPIKPVADNIGLIAPCNEVCNEVIDKLISKNKQIIKELEN